jgi:hypothetical protein
MSARQVAGPQHELRPRQASPQSRPWPGDRPIRRRTPSRERSQCPLCVQRRRIARTAITTASRPCVGAFVDCACRTPKLDAGRHHLPSSRRLRGRRLGRTRRPNQAHRQRIPTGADLAPVPTLALRLAQGNQGMPSSPRTAIQATPLRRRSLTSPVWPFQRRSASALRRTPNVKACGSAGSSLKVMSEDRRRVVAAC